MVRRLKALLLIVPFLSENLDHWITMPNARGTGRQYTVWQAWKLVGTLWSVAYWDPMPEDWDKGCAGRAD